MPSLEMPPAWTVPIAEVTAWFNWDALGAIGSFGALFLALLLATRDSRDRRERSASLVMAVMHPIGTVIQMLEDQWEKGRKGNLNAADVFNYILVTQVLEEMRSVMDEVHTKELPTARAMDAFVAARAAIKNIGIEGKKYADESPHLLVDWVPKRAANLRRYHSVLAEEALRFVSAKRLLKEMMNIEPETDATPAKTAS
jgi:hypothetical protein